MIRFFALSVVTVLALLLTLGGGIEFFGGVTVLAVAVASYGLLVTLCTELLGRN